MKTEDKPKLLVLSLLFPSGPESNDGIFVQDYIKCIRDKYNVFVINMKLSDENRFEVREHRDYTHILITKRYFLLKQIYYLSCIFNAYRYIRKHHRDACIMHVHESIIHGMLAVIVKKRLNIKYIITEHTNPFSKISKKLLSRILVKPVYKNADIVLPVSNHTKKEIIEAGIEAKEFRVIYNPVDTDLFVMNSENPAYEHKTMMFSSNLTYYKGGLRTLEAFHKICGKYGNWKLLIAGGGEEMQDIKNYYNANDSLKNKVILAGKKTKPEIADLMSKSDFFVLPSEHESFGISFCEAMSCGLPVIAGNNTAPKEYINDDCGILLDTTAPDSIAKAMEYMIANHKNYDRHKIRENVVCNYGFHVFGNRLDVIYKKSGKACAE